MYAHTMQQRQLIRSRSGGVTDSSSIFRPQRERERKRDSEIEGESEGGREEGRERERDMQVAM